MCLIFFDLDKECVNYGFCEVVLVKFLVDVLGLFKEFEDVKKFINWCKGG